MKHSRLLSLFRRPNPLRGMYSKREFSGGLGAAGLVVLPAPSNSYFA
jgi:hypothetical protein